MASLARCLPALRWHPALASVPRSALWTSPSAFSSSSAAAPHHACRLLPTSTLRLYATKPPTGPLKNDALLAHLVAVPQRGTPSSSPTTVYFIDESGKDQGQHDLRTLLATTDRSTYDLIQVATRPAGGRPVPIVRLVSRKAQYDKLKSAQAAKKAQAAPEHTEKEVQVGCKVAQADLLVKVNKAKDFLAKGFRVKLTVVHKPGSPRDAKKDVMREMLDLVDPLVASVVKPPHEVGRNWSTIVVGKRPAAPAAEGQHKPAAKPNVAKEEPRDKQHA